MGELCGFEDLRGTGNGQSLPPTRNQTTPTELTAILQQSRSQSEDFAENNLRGRGIFVATTNVFNDIIFGITGFGIADGGGSLWLSNDLASTITVTKPNDIASIARTLANTAGGQAV